MWRRGATRSRVAALGGATVVALFACSAAAWGADAPDAGTAARADGTAAAPQPAAPPGLIHEPAPRPQAAIRVQPRFAVKAHLVQVFAGAEYLSRGDFYNSPGVRVGAAYYLLEPLAVEVQASHYWSSLDATAEQVKASLGALPDSRPPGWLLLAGARYSIGYGKVMVGGLGGVIHFEPQAFAHAGVHDNDGDVGPSADAGLGFLVFLTPRLFARADAAIVFDRESRSGQTVSVWGTLPALSLGGML
jgi:outer membrane beta-barrel protein